MLEEGEQKSSGQPNSNVEVKVGESTRRSSGKPSSPTDKNILVDQLIMDLPKSIEEVENEKKRKREVWVNPTLLKKTVFLQIS